jgi:hypothetical protein
MRSLTSLLLLPLEPAALVRLALLDRLLLLEQRLLHLLLRNRPALALLDQITLLRHEVGGGADEWRAHARAARDECHMVCGAACTRSFAGRRGTRGGVHSRRSSGVCGEAG